MVFGPAAPIPGLFTTAVNAGMAGMAGVGSYATSFLPGYNSVPTSEQIAAQKAANAKLWENSNQYNIGSGGDDGGGDDGNESESSSTSEEERERRRRRQERKDLRKGKKGPGAVSYTHLTLPTIYSV